MSLNDLFYAAEHADICNVADDTTLNCSSNDINEAIINIKHDCTVLVGWFLDNFIILNALKCRLLVAGCKDELMLASVEDALLWEGTPRKNRNGVLDIF